MFETARRFRVNSPQAVHQTINDEVVLINLDRGHYYSLTGTGAAIWGFVERDATQAEIVDGLLLVYDAPRSEVEHAVGLLLSELAEAELVSALPDTAPPEHAASPSFAATSNGQAARRAFDPPTLTTFTDMESLLLLDPVHNADWLPQKPD